MINNLHIGRIYVFEASQFWNHFLKNGIFAYRHCLYKTGTYKVRNEIETNETKRNEINENETKRNEINKNETKRNEMKTK